jgi:hypothetical protein
MSSRPGIVGAGQNWGSQYAGQLWLLRPLLGVTGIGAGQEFWAADCQWTGTWPLEVRIWLSGWRSKRSAGAGDR